MALLSYIKLEPGTWLLLKNNGEVSRINGPPNVRQTSPLYEISWSSKIVDLRFYDYRLRWIYIHESLLS